MIAQFACCTSRTSSASAIYDNLLIKRQSRLGFLHEVTLLVVNVNSPFKMPFGKFAGGSHIQDDHIGIGGQFRKALNVCILKVLLTTC